MFESFGFETLTAPQVTVFFALAIGVFFGFLGERTKFCFRRSLVGDDRRAAAGVWATALAVALIGTQTAVALELISFDDHRFMATELPVLAVVVGGLMFGAGMILTRGCVSRLTILIGTGNLRALLVVIIFSIVVHSTMKGLLAPLRIAITSITTSVDSAALPGNPLIWTVLGAITALIIAVRSGNKLPVLLGAAVIGLLVPLAWVGTGFVLFDDFDPVALESLSFTQPASEALFYGIAASAIPAGFGSGLIGGVVIGSLIAALLFGSFTWQSFETPAQTGRYLLGASLMGIGGVVAGGCTVGAGLSGVPTLSIAAILALISIATGAIATHRVLNLNARESAGLPTTPLAQPAK